MFYLPHHLWLFYCLIDALAKANYYSEHPQQKEPIHYEPCPNVQEISPVDLRGTSFVVAADYYMGPSFQEVTIVWVE